MTREEAIQELQNCKGLIQQDGQDYLDERDFPLLDMAIEALQTDLVRCKDCRHRDLFSCPLADNDFQKDEDFCSWGERKEP